MSRDWPRKTVTMADIQRLTGHETVDGVRMALKRAGIKACAARVELSLHGWPPKKIYDADEIWRHFATRIVSHAEQDADAKELCWEVYGSEISKTVAKVTAQALFADRL